MEQIKGNSSKKTRNVHDSADSAYSLAKVIRLRRRTLELTQEDLSDISGVSLRLIHEVEHGKDSVRLGNLIRILSSVGMHLELTQGASDQITVDPDVQRLMQESK